jgi:hypothetical protein
MGFSAGTTALITSIGGAAVSAGLGAALSKRPSLPPSPVIPAEQQNVQVQQTALEAQQRASIAGGMQSTVGTPGGQTGQMLDPSNLGQHTLLGM